MVLKFLSTGIIYHVIVELMAPIIEKTILLVHKNIQPAVMEATNTSGEVRQVQIPR